ncbi:hypothetical protein EV421DRAFT_1900615 [Armillaria borealis]|uniref:Uncharacterized protein n=1 Tax=Armillaria borealis TaxID=47425 RepID=A0AA39JSH4_9AGAR|nr:hypothetical protein EV421DRAFT_1900615 [Armillaria borealis]
MSVPAFVRARYFAGGRWIVARQTLADDLEAFIADHEDVLDKLAAKHGMSGESIRRSVTNVASHRSPRSTNLANTILSDKMLKINEGKAPGDRLRLKEVKCTIADDEDYQNLSKEWKKELIDGLEGCRRQKQLSIHGTCHGVALDAQGCTGRVQREMAGCAYRTGVVGFSIFSRGHLDDQAIPECIDVDGALDFFPEALNMNVCNIIRLFDKYITMRSLIKRPREDRDAMRKEASKAISDGLECITRYKVRMNYDSFDTAIKAQHHIQIVGWPEGVDFKSPSDIGPTEDLCVLRDVLRSSACHWARMSKKEVEEFERELAQMEKKTRKPREDKGTKRQRSADEGGEGDEGDEQVEEERPAKRKKAGTGGSKKAAGRKSGSSKARGKNFQGMVPPKSKEFVESDEDGRTVLA